ASSRIVPLPICEAWNRSFPAVRAAGYARPAIVRGRKTAKRAARIVKETRGSGHCQAESQTCHTPSESAKGAPQPSILNWHDYISLILPALRQRAWRALVKARAYWVAL